MNMETGRLNLRRFRNSDLDDFFEYAKDPDVGPSAGWKPHKTKEYSRDILKTFMASADLFALELKSSCKVIGSIGLHEDMKRDYKEGMMIGYAMGKPYWGKGLMAEAVNAVLHYAFHELGLKIVSAYHYPFNHQSKRVLEKAGFQYEGTLRLSSILPDGTIVDDVCYSITKEEYEESVRSRNKLNK